MSAALLEVQDAPVELPSELWLRIFGLLHRNDIDSCTAACRGWQQLAKIGHKRLPRRRINYIIISSKRLFSITVCSGDVIRIFKFDKYFTKRTLRLSLNDKSHMHVETLRRGPATERFFRSAFVEELIAPSTEQTANQGGDATTVQAHEEVKNWIVDFNVPSSTKTRYKIKTPPRLFFYQLNSLLRNCESLDYFLFYRFSLTDAFLENCLRHVYFIPKLQHLRSHRSKRTGIKYEYFEYLSSLLRGQTAYKP